MAIAASYPTIKPSLLLDFANAKAVDPRITFTRSTTAKYYDGVTTAKAEENLLLQSQTFNTTWAATGATVSPDTTTAPDGTTTADSLIETTADSRHQIDQSSLIGGLSTYTLSIFIKKGSVQYVSLYAINTSGLQEAGAVFDLDGVSAVSGGVGTFSATSASIVSVGSGWYRCSVVVTNSSTLVAAFRVAHRATAYTSGAISESYIGNTGNFTYLWGAQLEQRSAVTAYTPTTTQPITNYIPVLQTAAAGVPRIDHDVRPTLSGTGTVSGSTITLPTAFADGSAPDTSNDAYNGMAITVASSAFTVTDYVGSTRVATLSGSPTTGSQAFTLQNPSEGECLGLLIEEQRVNLLTYSEEFDNAAWVKNGTTITANTVVAPDGTLTGEKLVEDTSNGNHDVYQNVSVTPITYASSYFLKAGERTKVAFRNGAANVGVFNLITGVFDSLTGLSSTEVKNVGNGWWRVSFIRVNTDTATRSFGVFLLDGSGNATYTGDGYSGIYIWGAQVEAGAFPTSYIPTVATQETRSPDAASMTGTNFSSWFNNGEGTFYSEATTGPNTTSLDSDGDTIGVACFHDGTNSNRIRHGLAANNLSVVYAGTTVANITVGAYAAKTTYKSASAYQTNDFQFANNGVLGTADTSGNVPTVTTLQLAASGINSASGSLASGYIRKIAYYPQRLTNTNLQALTA